MLAALTSVLCLAPQGEPTVAGRVLDEAGKPVAHPQAYGTLANLLPNAISGDDGRFELLLPPFNARVRLQVTGSDPKQTAMVMIDWDPNAPKPIAITLAKQ